MVVMMPEVMPKVLWRTLTTGARQLVVQLALEIMLCFVASYLLSLTPRTRVMSSLLAGAEMITFLTVLPRWDLAFSASVKKPVDSTTIWAPTEAQSSLAGSRSAKTLIFLPSMAMKSAPEVISCLRLPRMESYLRRWARVAGVVDGCVCVYGVGVVGFTSFIVCVCRCRGFALKCLAVVLV